MLLITIWWPPSRNIHPWGQWFLCRVSMLHRNKQHCIMRQLAFKSQSFRYVLVHNFTTLPEMSYRFYFVLDYSSRVNIREPAVHCIKTNHVTITKVEFRIILISTTISDYSHLNTSLLEVMISSKNERVFIHILSNLTLTIISGAWWISMNVGSKHWIAWNNSRQAPLWHFYLHCGIQENGSPGIICIICYQVDHLSSENGTSSMRNHLPPRLHSAKFTN